MTDLRKAAEMALKLLENNRLRTDEHLIPIVVDDLRNALAQDEQEPVWCGCGDGIVANDEAKCGVCVMRLENQIERLKAQPEQEPVAFEDWLKGQHGDPEEIGFLQALKITYEAGQDSRTAPPSKPWVSLTDEDIKEGAKYSWVDFQAFQSVAWWADELLKEKNT